MCGSRSSRREAGLPTAIALPVLAHREDIAHLAHRPRTVHRVAAAIAALPTAGLPTAIALLVLVHREDIAHLAHRPRTVHRMAAAIAALPAAVPVAAVPAAAVGQTTLKAVTRASRKPFQRISTTAPNHSGPWRVEQTASVGDDELTTRTGEQPMRRFRPMKTAAMPVLSSLLAAVLLVGLPRTVADQGQVDPPGRA